MSKIRKISIIIGLSIIYGGLIISFITKDKSVSYIENKILTQMPSIEKRTIVSGRFMEQFDTYVVDQFPGRVNWIKLKNTMELLLGKREFKNIYITNEGRLLEKFILNESNITSNINGINNLSSKYSIPSSLILIPTSTEIYKDELPSHAITDSQSELINDTIKQLIQIDYIPTLDILKENKDKDIFFKTDHHWTQEGAKIVFEKLTGFKIDKEAEQISDDFYGTYYSKVLLPNIEADDIFYYKNTGDYNIKIDFYNEKNNLYDFEKLNTKNQYQFFLSGDPGHAIIKGKGEKNILIFKDSFAHNFIPFLAEYCNEIHVIDARYFNLNIDEYISKNNFDNILYIHNISTLNTQKIY